MQPKESMDSDSNSYGKELNPDSSEVWSNGWIWISIQAIRISGEEISETKGRNSNPSIKDSILSWRTSEESEDWIWIT